MESTNFAKVLDSKRRVFVDLKRSKAGGFATFFSGASLNDGSRLLDLKAPSLKLGKRKRPDFCKFRSLPRYYTNFMKSGMPKRVMFYQNEGWVDHEPKIIAMIKSEFELKKAVVDMKLSDDHMIFDFVRMVQFNFRTALELPMAWIDENGGCFFPEVYTNVDELNECFHYENQEDELSSPPAQDGVQEIKLQIEIEVNGLGENKAMEYCGETSPLVKRIKVGQNVELEDACDKVSDVRVNEGVGENQHLEKKANSDVNIDAETVKGMFLEGMKIADGIDVVGIDSKSGSMLQGRLELFLKQAEITEKFRGNANVRYAWLGTTKEASSGIMAYGLGHFGLKQIKSNYGVGIHLAAASCANISANYCDVDENGVRYMVLCRVIMGNMEMVHAGSKQFHPSNENFDSGVDDLQNPRQYVVWSMNINTHICPEYVVSFKVSTNHKGSVLMNDHNHVVKPVHESAFNPSKVGGTIDMVNDHQSNVTHDGSKEGATSLNSTTIRVPKSPWMPFPILLAGISKKVPASDMNLVLTHYEQFKNKVIKREDFVKNLRLIVGDTILKTSIVELNSKVTPKKGTLMVAQNPEIAG